MFEHQVFVPHPYAIIDLDVMELAGKTTLFGACRLSDMKMGQVVTFELASDQAKFERALPRLSPWTATTRSTCPRPSWRCTPTPGVA